MKRRIVKDRSRAVVANKPKVSPLITIRYKPNGKELALIARGNAALIVAGAVGVGLLAWMIAVLVKMVW